jgi:hypothetical protein
MSRKLATFFSNDHKLRSSLRQTGDRCFQNGAMMIRVAAFFVAPVFRHEFHDLQRACRAVETSKSAAPFETDVQLPKIQPPTFPVLADGLWQHYSWGRRASSNSVKERISFGL